ncbi:kelch-like protein 17 [Paramacrobiotus metropolitanus]|uniref:kelch-like protein 17 n=1 Tax=Paramacrobiotus metropolitanus TaxID=2943436 RepID=UPI002445B03C|nr:kelch-like protein 17 [Paramacrobiotus metropolitanus]
MAMPNASRAADHPAPAHQHPHDCEAVDEFLRGMRELQATGTLCDVVLQGSDADDVEGSALANGIPCHRAVLTVHSAYFRAVFTHNWKDSRDPVFPLHNVDTATINALVRYAYTLTIRLNADNVASILVAAQFLQMDRVAGQCWAYLQRHLNVANCLVVHSLASNHHRPDLAAAALALIHQHFLQLAETPEFLKMNAQQLVDVLASDAVAVVSEDQVWQALQRWLAHDHAARRAQLHTVLPLVCVPFLSEPAAREYGLALASAPATSTGSGGQNVVAGGSAPHPAPRHSYGEEDKIPGRHGKKHWQAPCCGRVTDNSANLWRHIYGQEATPSQKASLPCRKWRTGKGEKRYKQQKPPAELPLEFYLNPKIPQPNPEEKTHRINVKRIPYPDWRVMRIREKDKPAKYTPGAAGRRRHPAPPPKRVKKK